MNTPLYKQVEESIKSEIKNGRWVVGQQIPTESNLCSLYDVSMITIRRALNNLESDGFLVRVQGKGTFVTQDSLHYSLSGKLMGFTEEVLAQGRNPGSIVLDCGFKSPTEEIAEKLELVNHEKVFFLERARLIDGNLSRIVISNIAYRYFPNIENFNFSTNSLFDVFTNVYGFEPVRSIAKLDITLANEEMSKKLEVSPNSPLYFFQTTFYTSNQIPIEHSIAYIRPETISYDFEFRK